MAENAFKLGNRFRDEIMKLDSSVLLSVRGRGLLNAIVINERPNQANAWELCLRLRDNGLLAKPTHGNIIRLAPPLCMTEAEMDDCTNILKKVLTEAEP